MIDRLYTKDQPTNKERNNNLTSNNDDFSYCICEYSIKYMIQKGPGVTTGI